MHKKFIPMFLFFLIFGICTVSVNADCVLPLPRFRFFAPLIFTTNGKLLSTDNLDENTMTITVPTDMKVILSCAPNYFKKHNYNTSKTLTARCTNGEKFDVNGVESNWMLDLGCEVRPVEEILKPISGCPNDATSIEFGYENPIKQYSKVMGEACYSEKKGTTIFFHTKFLSSGQKKEMILEKESANYLAQKHPDSSYKMDFLVASRVDELEIRLKNLLSIKNVPYISYRHFVDLAILQNGQLNSALKLGWNFVVTNGDYHLPNYDLLLKDIMNLNERSFDLFLGTHSILSLNANGQNVDIHLLPDQRKYPAPMFLWTVVTTDNGKAVAFLISNDIDATQDELTKNAPCESVCSQLSWLLNLQKNDVYKNPQNGYIFCCELNQFMKIVSEMPALEGKFELLRSSESLKNDIEIF